MLSYVIHQLEVPTNTNHYNLGMFQEDLFRLVSPWALLWWIIQPIPSIRYTIFVPQVMNN